MATIDSLASIFFSSLIGDNGEAFKKLSSLIGPDSPYKESEWIEYKGGFYKSIEDVAQEWSKQLSGFANSGDGVLIWGIQTKTINKLDIPDKVVLVTDAKALAGELERLRGFAVEPPVHGVIILPVVNPKGEGFVVAFIPESKRRPHQVRLDKVEVRDRYYIRNGHSTEPARPSLLRMLFYPQFSPQLSLSHINHGRTGDLVTAEIYLRNNGTVSVSELDLVATDIGKDVHFVPNLQDFKEYRRARDAIGYFATRPLHPEYSIHLGGTVLRPEQNFTINIFGKDMKPFRWKYVRKTNGDYESIELP